MKQNPNPNIKTLGLTPLQRRVLYLLAARQQFYGSPRSCGVRDKGWMSAGDLQQGDERLDPILHSLVKEGYCDYRSLADNKACLKHAFRVNAKGLAWLALASELIGEKSAVVSRRTSLVQLRSRRPAKAKQA